jgi:ribose transport system permease protein
VIAALTMRLLGDSGLSPIPTVLVGLIVCLVSGAIFGAVNGVIITKLRVNSLIGTLGTLGIGSGAAQLLTNGQDVRRDCHSNGSSFGYGAAFPNPRSGC